MERHEYYLHIDVYIAIVHPGSLSIGNQNPTSNQPTIDQPFLNEVFIALVFLVIFGIGFVFVFAKWRAKNAQELKYPEKPTYQPIEPVIRLSNNNIPSDVLQHYWYCPRDLSRLQVVSSRTADNASFIISKNNVTNGINNAIAMRKISPDLQYQTEQLATYLYTTYVFSELPLVSARCSTCSQFFAIPKF